MTIAELVKKLMDAGASAEVVAIAVQALEEERNPPPRRHVRTRAADGGKVVDLGR
jgi:hypothetical protein